MLSMTRFAAPVVAVVASMGITAAAGGHTVAATARPGAGPLISGWTACSITRQVSGTEIRDVQAWRIPCSRAAKAIAHARPLFSPGGPIFSTAGYRCAGKNLEPITPAPSELPQLVHCTGRHGHELRFLWISS
jgi:hypothetical protein